MGAELQGDVRAFRGAVFPWFLCCFACFDGVGAPLALCIIVLLVGGDLTWLYVGSVLLSGLLCAAAFGPLYASRYSTRLSAERVFGYSLWGTPRSLRWQEMAKVKPFRFFTIRFLRLYPCNGTAPTWIVMTLADRAGFETEVYRLAPPDSPIRSYLG